MDCQLPFSGQQSAATISMGHWLLFKILCCADSWRPAGSSRSSGADNICPQQTNARVTGLCCGDFSHLDNFSREEYMRKTWKAANLSWCFICAISLVKPIDTTLRDQTTSCWTAYRFLFCFRQASRSWQQQSWRLLLAASVMTVLWDCCLSAGSHNASICKAAAAPAFGSMLVTEAEQW
jgi:hypothetical protein